MAESAGGATASAPDDRGNLAAMVDRHHVELYRYAYRLTGMACDAEDLTQQVFLTAQVKLYQLRDPNSSRGWLFTILRHCYLKSRKQRRPAPAANLDLDIDSLPAELPEADLFDLTDIDRDQLQEALDELPEEFKLVLLMFYFEDCSYREIAARLGLPLGTVMSRLSRAKSHLRNRLFAAGCEGPAADSRGTPNAGR